MQTMQQRISRFLAVSATSLALSIGTLSAVHAQEAASAPTLTPGQATHARHAGMHGKHGARGWHGRHGGFMLGLQKLHGRLNLKADQEKQYQDALNTAKQNHEAMRANFKQFRQQIDTLKQQPILDMSALHDARQHLAQQNAQLRDQTENAWLSFYNGLNDQQKTTVSNALKARFAKAGQHHAKMHGHGHGHPHAKNGAAASAPAAQ